MNKEEKNIAIDLTKKQIEDSPPLDSHNKNIKGRRYNMKHQNNSNLVIRSSLATLKPTTLLAMFNAPQLKDVAREVEDTIVKIMTEAASG